MDGPIVFVSRSRVKDGKLQALRDFMERGTPALEADKPRTLVFLPFLSEDGTELTIFHVFADAASMDAHLEGAGERSKAAYEFIETASFEVYGAPSGGTLEAMQQITTTGARFEHEPESFGGFIRPTTG